jgi:hypothetical protein
VQAGYLSTGLVSLHSPGAGDLSFSLRKEKSMSFENWAAFTAASTVLLMIPGPTVLLVVSYALGQGWRTALPMAVGVALGDFTAMTLSMLGIGALLAASATVFTILKFVGAGYGGENDGPRLAGHRAEPEEHYLLRRLPAAVS